MSKRLNPQIIEQAKNGDLQALEALIDRFQKPLFFYALQYLGNHNEAEDITQEVLMKVFKALPDFKGQASFKTWVYKIMTNACIDFHRKKSVGYRMIGHHLGNGEEAYGNEPMDPSPTLEERYERYELKESIRAALATLSPEHRLTVILHDLHGFKYREIAKLTGSNLGTVKSRLFYARQTLRKILTPVLERGDH